MLRKPQTQAPVANFSGHTIEYSNRKPDTLKPNTIHVYKVERNLTCSIFTSKTEPTLDLAKKISTDIAYVVYNDQLYFLNKKGKPECKVMNKEALAFVQALGPTEQAQMIDDPKPIFKAAEQDIGKSAASTEGSIRVSFMTDSKNDKKIDVELDISQSRMAEISRATTDKTGASEMTEKAIKNFAMQQSLNQLNQNDTIRESSARKVQMESREKKTAEHPLVKKANFYLAKISLLLSKIEQSQDTKLQPIADALRNQKEQMIQTLEKYKGSTGSKDVNVRRMELKSRTTRDEKIKSRLSLAVDMVKNETKFRRQAKSQLEKEFVNHDQFIDFYKKNGSLDAIYHDTPKPKYGERSSPLLATPAKPLESKIDRSKQVEPEPSAAPQRSMKLTR